MADSRPRILHLVGTLEKAGGAQRLLLAVLKQLPRERLAFSVAGLSGKSEIDAELASLAVPLFDLRKRSRFDPIGVRATRRLVREENIALVHCHLSRAEIVGTLALAKLPQVPLVIHKHNDDAWWNRLVLGLLHRRIVKRANRIVVVSDSIGGFFSRLDSRVAAKLVRIHNGIDVAGVRAVAASADRVALRESFGIGATEKLIIAVGRLTPQKGHDILLRALAEPPLASIGAKLLLVGRGEERERLEILARTSRVAERTIFADVRPDVPALMAAADVLAMPSRWEGFGLVVAEAFAAGCPVVASRVSALPELVEPEVTGLLVPPEDPAALAAALARVLGDPELASRLASGARARVAASFDVSETAAGWLRLYDELLEKPR